MRTQFLKMHSKNALWLYFNSLFGPGKGQLQSGVHMHHLKLEEIILIESAS